MNRPTVASRWNLELIEETHRRWRENPASVDESWRNFFEGFEIGQSGAAAQSSPTDLEAARAQAAVTRLIDAYREIGHYLADLDPLDLVVPSQTHELLEPSAFGLGEQDHEREYFTRLNDPPRATLRELIAILRETYCRTIGVEYMYIRNIEVRRWLQERMEPNRNQPNFDTRQKRRIILKLNSAELFESFLHQRFLGQKRFSLEGGEALIPMLDAIIDRSAKHGVRQIVMGMAHRGRLNVLANILNKPYGTIFSEFEGNMTVETDHGDGDVKYHLGYSTDYVTSDGQKVYLSLTPNPSHLEFVNPVVEGRVRAKQRKLNDTDRILALPLLIHGDAAFAGQGIVAETLNLSQLPGYRTGGTIHVVINNQIGFTTSPGDSRSTRYATDIAKMLEVPIFHVNGDDAEAVVYVAELAMDFREKFGQDVVIDLVCYRKYGHNEGDEPTFTQPVMYEAIGRHKSVRQIYTEQLIREGVISQDEAETISETFREKMDSIFEEIHTGDKSHRPQTRRGFTKDWSGFSPLYSFDPVETGVPYERLKAIAESFVRFPDGFRVNPKVERVMTGRLKAVESHGAVDWSTAESLAFASLLLEDTPVRLSGQDSRRGTFSQRHSTLVCTETGQKYVPMNHIEPGQRELRVYDSLLSEAAVLGFEYGYSLDDPKHLILWEAQFGDFANGAQVIIDQFIASGESKWGRSSGVVMLLPHGYEGQGPEHSSARLERFLQLCAEDNIQVVNASTPAQYFHLLRRQVRRSFRKPLVVMTPKSLLRHKAAVSAVDELVTGRFHEVLDDSVQPDSVRRVLFCSGKVYYDLIAQRETAEKTNEVAIVRVEQLYPWPAEQVRAAIGRYRSAREWVWVQEESQNMGSWFFAAPRLQETLESTTQRRDVRIQFVGRDASASPATGSHHVHEREQTELVQAAIGASLPHLVSAHSH